jgi:hypothetical protein
MNSIEWFTDEVFRTLNYHYEGNLPAVIAGLKISEAKHKAIEMYKNEIAANDNQPVADNQDFIISDEEIERIGESYRIFYNNKVGNGNLVYKHYIEGIKWYREHIKINQ